MVVEEKPADRFAEMVRLNRLIRSSVDLLVVSDEKFQYWRDTPAACITRPPPAGRSYMKRREQALLFLRTVAQNESLLDAVLQVRAESDHDTKSRKLASRFWSRRQVEST